MRLIAASSPSFRCGEGRQDRAGGLLRAQLPGVDREVVWVQRRRIELGQQIAQPDDVEKLVVLPSGLVRQAFLQGRAGGP